MYATVQIGLQLHALLAVQRVMKKCMPLARTRLLHKRCHMQSGAKQKALSNTPDRSIAASANDEALQFLQQAMAEAKPKAS